MKICKQFGENLRFLREASGIAARGKAFSQQEIADFIGVSRKTVVFWESGHVPSPKRLGLLCEFFSRRLGLEEPLTPEDMLEKRLSDHFLLFPERGEVMRVTPEQKKLLENIFARSAHLPLEDLEKVVELVERLSGEI